MLHLFIAYYIIIHFFLGCQNTPAKTSRYRSVHSDTAMVFQDDFADNPPTTGIQNNTNSTPGSLIIRVLNEKETRQGEHLQVNL